MVNNTIIEGTYNLSSIISGDIINDPTNWLISFNSELSGLLIVSFMVVFAIVLFVIARQNDDVKDSRAAVYSGLVVSVIGLLLFFIEPNGGDKLLSFGQLLIFLVATSISILIDRIS